VAGGVGGRGRESEGGLGMGWWILGEGRRLAARILCSGCSRGLLVVSESSRMDGATHARLAYNCDGCIMD